MLITASILVHVALALAIIIIIHVEDRGNLSIFSAYERFPSPPLQPTSTQKAFPISPAKLVDVTPLFQISPSMPLSIRLW